MALEILYYMEIKVSLYCLFYPYIFFHCMFYTKESSIRDNILVIDRSLFRAPRENDGSSSFSV